RLAEGVGRPAVQESVCGTDGSNPSPSGESHKPDRRHGFRFPNISPVNGSCDHPERAPSLTYTHKRSRRRRMPTPARRRVANPRQGDFAKPDSEENGECPAARLADELILRKKVPRITAEIVNSQPQSQPSTIGFPPQRKFRVTGLFIAEYR